jgi:hypothetical protein
VDEVLLEALPLQAIALVGLDLELTVAIDVAKVGDDTGRARRAARNLNDHLRCTGHGAHDVLELGR